MGASVGYSIESRRNLAAFARLWHTLQRPKNGDPVLHPASYVCKSEEENTSNHSINVIPPDGNILPAHFNCLHVLTDPDTAYPMFDSLPNRLGY
jgi:hypothetical protein